MPDIICLSNLIDEMIEYINEGTTSEVVEVYNKIFDKSVDWKDIETDECCEITRDPFLKR